MDSCDIFTHFFRNDYSDVIMKTIVSQITSVSIVCSTVCSGAENLRGSKKTSKPRGTGLCKGNRSVTGGLPAQRASNAENLMTSSWCLTSTVSEGYHFYWILPNDNKTIQNMNLVHNDRNIYYYCLQYWCRDKMATILQTILFRFFCINIIAIL